MDAAHLQRNVNRRVLLDIHYHWTYNRLLEAFFLGREAVASNFERIRDVFALRAGCDNELGAAIKIPDPDLYAGNYRAARIMHNSFDSTSVLLPECEGRQGRGDYQDSKHKWQ
jgi:hypothetical protein